jgi:uncharacterized protein (TIGR00251 family)
MFEQFSPFNKITDGISLHIRVTAAASKNRIGKVFVSESGVNTLKVYVSAVAEDGKANKAVIELLAKNWSLSKSNIKIIRGLTDRNKLVEMHGNSHELMKRLLCMLN